jgi:hypothetical protein
MSQHDGTATGILVTGSAPSGARTERHQARREGVVLTIEVRDEAEQREVEALLSAVIPVLRDRNDRVRDILDAILPPQALLGAGAAAQSRRNAVLRDRIAREYGLLSASDLATAAGSRASNSAATATRWRQAGKIFSVTVGTMNYYPAFQFGADGAPLPQVSAVLKVLGDHLRGWELAAWLTQPLDELDRRTPIEAWSEDLAAVLEAAEAVVARLDD